MTETDFNSKFRAVLRAQGLGALHIREADQPGAADLAIWQGRRSTWVELKIDDHEVEPHQEQFLVARAKEGGLAFVVRLTQKDGGPFSVQVTQYGPHRTTFVGNFRDYHRVAWADVLI